MKPVIVIGAGVGGLTTAAVLARAGMDVTVLEAHIYPGGCAGTFYHQGYRFDAGATLAGGFYPGGPMDLVARAAGIPSWPVEYPEIAMLVHLPDGERVRRYTDERRWDEQSRAFGAGSDPFFRWQEDTADALWQLALRLPDWPPHGARQAANLIAHGVDWALHGASLRRLPGLLRDAFRPVSAHFDSGNVRLRQFIDAQLLISAQASSRQVYALYGASALDLPRRGVAHLHGGMGAVADLLVQAVRQSGGQVLFRQEVTRLRRAPDRSWQVHTRRGETFTARQVVANLPLTNLQSLLGESIPHEPPSPQHAWGAFMVYIGLEESSLSPDAPLHHQIIQREPMAEGNTIFLSLSLPGDAAPPDRTRASLRDARAPHGHRALTISTHTDLRPWWRLHREDPPAYEARRDAYLERILQGAERIIPDLRRRAAVIMPGTPLTFERFTRRKWGWVGGYPQTSLFTARQPRLAEDLWIVGDSIFPGQSMPAVALGGLRVANAILAGAPGTVHTPAAQIIRTPPSSGLD